MASLTYKNPSEEFLGFVDRSDMQEITHIGVKHIKERSEQKGLHFAFKMSEKKKRALVQLGVDLYPYSLNAHSHPFCKTLENHFLLDVLPGVVGQSNWSFVSIKLCKLEVFVKSNNLNKNNFSFINRVLCAKDYGRYNLEVTEHIKPEFVFNLDRSNRLFTSGFLKRLHHRNVFIHDEVHHWSRKEMFKFLSKVRPKRLVFTVVYPPELLDGYTRSQNPELYTFTIHGNLLRFNPDGVTSEGYEQPADLTWLFKASHFNFEDCRYTCKLIKSQYAHHMFEVVRGHLHTDSYRVFSNFENIDLRVIKSQRFMVNQCPPIRYDFISKVYTYLNCLKKPDKQSGLAKLRQLMDQEQDVEITMFFQSLIELMLGSGSSLPLFGVSFKKKFKHTFLSKLPDCLARVIPGWSAHNLFDFLMNCRKMTVQIKTEVITDRYVSNFDLNNFEEEVKLPTDYDELMELMESYSRPLTELRVENVRNVDGKYNIHSGFKKNDPFAVRGDMWIKALGRRSRKIPNLKGVGTTLTFFEYLAIYSQMCSKGQKNLGSKGRGSGLNLLDYGPNCEEPQSVDLTNKLVNDICNLFNSLGCLIVNNKTEKPVDLITFRNVIVPVGIGADDVGIEENINGFLYLTISNPANEHEKRGGTSQSQGLAFTGFPGCRTGVDLDYDPDFDLYKEKKEKEIARATMIKHHANMENILDLILSSSKEQWIDSEAFRAIRKECANCKFVSYSNILENVGINVDMLNANDTFKQCMPTLRGAVDLTMANANYAGGKNLSLGANGVKWQCKFDGLVQLRLELVREGSIFNFQGIDFRHPLRLHRQVGLSITEISEGTHMVDNEVPVKEAEEVDDAGHGFNHADQKGKIEQPIFHPTKGIEIKNPYLDVEYVNVGSFNSKEGWVMELKYNPIADGSCFYRAALHYRGKSTSDANVQALRLSLANSYNSIGLTEDAERVARMNEWATHEDISLLLNAAQSDILVSCHPIMDGQPAEVKLCSEYEVNLAALLHIFNFGDSTKRTWDKRELEEMIEGEEITFLNNFNDHFQVYTLSKGGALRPDEEKSNTKADRPNEPDSPIERETSGGLGAKQNRTSDLPEGGGSDTNCGEPVMDSTGLHKAQKICNLKGIQMFLIDEKEKTFTRMLSDCRSIIGLLGKDKTSHVTIKGRKAFFFAMDEQIKYGHDSVNYRTNNWFPEFSKILAFLSNTLNIDVSGYNGLLLQLYNKKAKIPLHQDNEVCYDNSGILQLNLNGSGTFTVLNVADRKKVRFPMRAGSVFLFDGEFQERYKHGVCSDTEDRITLTFRQHKKDLFGNQINKIVDDPIELKMDAIKNTCIFDAISMALNREKERVMKLVCSRCPGLWNDWIKLGKGIPIADCIHISNSLEINLQVHDVEDGKKYDFGEFATTVILKFEQNHYELVSILEKGFMNSKLVDKKGLTNSTGGATDSVKRIERFLQSLDHMTKIPFVPSNERASCLSRAFLEGSIGVRTSAFYDNAGSLFEFLKKNEVDGDCRCNINLIAGFGGSGKSRALQNFIPICESRVLIILPRSNLANDWSDKISEVVKLKRAKVVTYEVALRLNMSGFGMVILDELTLFPSGYLDLVALKIDDDNSKTRFPKPAIVTILCPFQARDYNAKARFKLDPVACVDNLIGGREINYLNASYRLSKDFYSGLFETQMLGPSAMESDGDIRLDNEPCFYTSLNDLSKDGIDSGINDSIIVSSQEELTVLGAVAQCYTFGTSQGLTFNRACVVLSVYSTLNSHFDWMVALTRSRFGVDFLVDYPEGIKSFIKKLDGTFQGKIIKRLYERSVNYARTAYYGSTGLANEPVISNSFLARHTSAEINFIDAKIGGLDEVCRETRLDGDLYLKSKIFLGQRVDVEEVIPELVSLEEPKMKTHVFISMSHGQFARSSEKLRVKEDREGRLKGLVTDQFCDNYEKVSNQAVKTYPGPMRFEAIYPRHKTDDDATFWMAVQKRLKFSDPGVESRKFHNSKGLGRTLMNILNLNLSLENKWDQSLFEVCLNEFEEKKISKSCATIANNASRSDPDWQWDAVFLFIKNQLCTKFEKQYVDAKAGQTISCFAHSILCKFAPYCRYMEKKFRNSLPDNFYIHSNKNFDDLDEWVKKYGCGETSLESDYEAFDASQDHVVLAFECELMSHYSIPREVIDDYIHLKVNLGCKLGRLAIMRFSGEFGTFFFNTVANMLYTFLRYEVPKGTPVAFAGDDMCALTEIKQIHKYDTILEKFNLKAKVIVTKSPMFCGWLISNHGIVKEPELIFNRFQVAFERGNIHECIENYAIEASYAYRLGEKLFEVLKTERQIEAHQEVVRTIVTNLWRVKGKVRELYSDQS